MRILIFAMLGLAAIVAGCENSVDSLAEPKAAPDNPSDGWRPTWSEVANARLRPGSLIGPSGCTAGFLFVDPVNQAYYLGTAAHCTDSADGTTQDGTGTRVELKGVGGIGTVVFDSDGPTPNSGLIRSNPTVDFSLMLLDPDINLIAHPQVISFQGPTGFSDCLDISTGDLIALYGHGEIFEPVGPRGREGVFDQCNDGTFEGVLPAYFGDSGGPVLHVASGKALGLVSGGGGVLVGPTLPYIFSALAKAGFGFVALATIDGGYAAPSVP